MTGAWRASGYNGPSVRALTTSLLALLLSAAAAFGEDPGAILEARGATLEAFDVVAHLDRVDRSSAETLARSFARLTVEERRVNLTFGDLFRSEHLQILRRYYAPDLVRGQTEDYRGLPLPGDTRCRYLGLKPVGDDHAVASLRRSWTEDAKRLERVVRLELVRRGDEWWVERIRDAQGDGTFRERDLGVPSALPATELPAAPARDLSSPKAAVESLKADIERLGAMRARASIALYRHYFAILETFYGEPTARAARARQTKAKPDIPHTFKINPHELEAGDSVRVAVLAVEEVPDTEGQHSVIGQVSFDLRRDGPGWRIFAEWARPDPTKAPVPQTTAFALFFLG